MKPHTILFLLAMLFFTTANSVLFAQWTQTNWPYSGDIASFAFSGSNIFAGTDNGVALSTDGAGYVGLSSIVA